MTLAGERVLVRLAGVDAEEAVRSVYVARGESPEELPV